MADKDLNTVSESLAFDANDFVIASIGGALKKVKKSLIYTKPVPSTGNTLTGALDLTNTEGTYYDAKTVTGALTFSISGSTESGWARGRLVCDGTNPFASDGNFTTIFEERVTGSIVGGLPNDYVLPPGTYSFYSWATDSGYSISINGPITDAVVPDVTAPATMTITNVTITGTDGDFTASLNGGDAVTADNDLIYKIYGSADGYTTPIKTTGSHTTDADVTVTGDSVTINNVNVGAETKFKITALDAASNESVKSDAYDTASIEYLSDNYAPAFGYGPFKIASTSTKCYELRRSSDNATTDLGFDSNGKANASATVSAGGTLATWAGSDTIYVTKIYNQGTEVGLFDLVQATTTKQAIIMAGGVWNAKGLLGDGIDDGYVSVGTDDYANNYFTIFSDLEVKSAKNNHIFGSFGTTTIERLFFLRGNSDLTVVLSATDEPATGGVEAKTSAMSLDVNSKIVAVSNATKVSVYLDGIEGTPQSPLLSHPTESKTLQYMDKLQYPTNFLDGYNRYVIFYKSDHDSNRSAIQSIIDSFL